MEKLLIILGFLIIGLSIFSGDIVVTLLGIYFGMSLTLWGVFWDFNYL